LIGFLLEEINIMTLVKFKKPNHNLVNGFNRMSPVFEDFFGPFDTLFNDLNIVNHAVPSANVYETEQAFMIQMAVPGFQKSDFQLEIKDDTLVVRLEKTSEKAEQEHKVLKKEFDYHQFQRNFTLPESVDRAQIDAMYESGLLNITLPKKQEVVKSNLKIQVR
jgi:HSP20 family protein